MTAFIRMIPCDGPEFIVAVYPAPNPKDIALAAAEWKRDDIPDIRDIFRKMEYSAEIIFADYSIELTEDGDVFVQ